jgi:hypothetical protein
VCGARQGTEGIDRLGTGRDCPTGQPSDCSCAHVPLCQPYRQYRAAKVQARSLPCRAALRCAARHATPRHATPRCPKITNRPAASWRREREATQVMTEKTPHTVSTRGAMHVFLFGCMTHLYDISSSPLRAADRLHRSVLFDSLDDPSRVAHSDHSIRQVLNSQPPQPILAVARRIHVPSSRRC